MKNLINNLLKKWQDPVGEKKLANEAFEDMDREKREKQKQQSQNSSTRPSSPGSKK